MAIPNLFHFALTISGIVIAIFFFIGLILVFFDSRHSKKRQARLQELFNSPSSLRWTSPQMERPSVTIPPLPSRPATAPQPVETPETSALPPQEELPSTESLDGEERSPIPEMTEELPSPPSKEEASSESLDETFDLGYSQDSLPQPSPQEATIGDAQESPTSFDTTLDFGSTPNDTLASSESQATEDSSAEEPPADQILYLDPDFELSEVKRILRVWSLIPEGDPDKEGRWTSEDGTSIRLKHPDEKGFPFLEIRGPMAEDLALYLPEDLPVHPMPFDK